METVFRSVGDAIISVDPELVVLELNESAQRICSLSREAIGRVMGTTGLRCRGRCLEALREALEGKRFIREHHVECRHEERGSQVVSLSIFPLIDHADNFSGAVMTARDETSPAGFERNRGEGRRFHNIIGGSDEMQEVFDLIDSLRDVETTVLIIGESGTGKELVADALHHGGRRTPKPFVKVNCGAIADNLLESELFGHVKGAFTGATADKVGRFQRAEGGTIFLDEIGNISPRMQLSLLRVLQAKEFERVGSSTPIRVDVRVIAATNQDLPEKIRKGEFREDLYYRLKVVKIAVPPLRERKEDIPLLVDHFLGKFNEKFGREITAVSDDVLEVFMAYHWPGNVRELEHAVEHAFILCRQKIVILAHLPSELNDSNGAGEKRGPSSQPFSGNNDRNTILSALEKAAWNKAKAARILGISRRTIFRKIKEYQMMEHQTHCRA
jgi:transcriptional regulator with PAS, ATPase and Fis domain